MALNRSRKRDFVTERLQITYLSGRKRDFVVVADNDLQHKRNSNENKMSQLGEDDLYLLEQSSKPAATLNATKWGVHISLQPGWRNLTCDWASISPRILTTC